MATELTVQSERAFQKQPHIFQNSKSQAKSKKAGQTRRWYKEVGLGFRTPKTAIEGTYIGMNDLRSENFGDTMRSTIFVVFSMRVEIGTASGQGNVLGS
jgi:hypothetical protein